jgi:hypothetical protein
VEQNTALPAIRAIAAELVPAAVVGVALGLALGRGTLVPPEPAQPIARAQYETAVTQPSGPTPSASARVAPPQEPLQASPAPASDAATEPGANSEPVARVPPAAKRDRRPGSDSFQLPHSGSGRTPRRNPGAPPPTYRSAASRASTAPAQSRPPNPLGAALTSLEGLAQWSAGAVAHVAHLFHRAHGRPSHRRVDATSGVGSRTNARSEMASGRHVQQRKAEAGGRNAP